MSDPKNRADTTSTVNLEAATGSTANARLLDTTPNNDSTLEQKSYLLLEKLLVPDSNPEKKRLSPYIHYMLHADTHKHRLLTIRFSDKWKFRVPKVQSGYQDGIDVLLQGVRVLESKDKPTPPNMVDLPIRAVLDKFDYEVRNETIPHEKTKTDFTLVTSPIHRAGIAIVAPIKTIGRNNVPFKGYEICLRCVEPGPRPAKTAITTFDKVQDLLLKSALPRNFVAGEGKPITDHDKASHVLDVLRQHFGSQLVVGIRYADNAYRIRFFNETKMHRFLEGAEENIRNPATGMHERKDTKGFYAIAKEAEIAPGEFGKIILPTIPEPSAEAIEKALPHAIQQIARDTVLKKYNVNKMSPEQFADKIKKEATKDGMAERARRKLRLEFYDIHNITPKDDPLPVKDDPLPVVVAEIEVPAQMMEKVIATIDIQQRKMR